MKLVSRKAWGARSPRAAAGRLSATKGVKVHYTGDTVDPRLKDDHDRCAPRVRQIQNFHMDGNGWNDIGYSAVVCPHSYVFVGRGPHALPAANGPGLNSGHYAVCGLVGNKGLTEPTAALLNGIRDAIEWLRREGGAGTEIKGHRDGYATDCPGEPLYAWVRKGAPRPGDDEEEDDLMGLTPDEIAEAVWKRSFDDPASASPEQAEAGRLLWRGAASHGEVRELRAEMAQLRDVIAEISRVVGTLAASSDTPDTSDTSDT